MLVTMAACSVALSIFMDGKTTWTSLILTCESTDNYSVLEIGDRHTLASKGSSVSRKQVHLKEITLRVQRLSQESEARVAKLCLSEDKIGELGFYPPYEDPKREASLEGNLFVSDSTFESLVEAVKVGKASVKIQIRVAKRGVLAFGWEPDGSRKTWKIEQPEDPSYVDITSATFELPLSG